MTAAVTKIFVRTRRSPFPLLSLFPQFASNVFTWQKSLSFSWLQSNLFPLKWLRSLFCLICTIRHFCLERAWTQTADNNNSHEDWRERERKVKRSYFREVWTSFLFRVCYSGGKNRELMGFQPSQWPRASYSWKFSLVRSLFPGVKGPLCLTSRNVAVTWCDTGARTDIRRLLIVMHLLCE